MIEPLDKLSTNPIRLMVMSILVKVDSCDFNYLKKMTSSTLDNLSIQLKRLFENNYISITKSFEKITPKPAVVSPKLGSEPLLLTSKPSNPVKILTYDPISFKGYSDFANSFQQSIPKNRGAIIYLLLNSPLQ